MSQFNVAITYTDGKPVVTWNPKPNGENPCAPGDQIAFSSPDQDTAVNFTADSPFETTPGPQQYAVPKGTTITKQIVPRAAGTTPEFHLLYSHDPKTMGVVPVGNGGPGGKKEVVGEAVPVHGGGPRGRKKVTGGAVPVHDGGPGGGD